ncbi:MAG: hypothetical protein WC615_17470 [Mucilaginibacter sp.]
MIYPQTGITAVSVAEVVPKGIDNLIGAKLADGIRPTLILMISRYWKLR